MVKLDGQQISDAIETRIKYSESSVNKQPLKTDPNDVGGCLFTGPYGTSIASM
ncbi:3625_t:CDS:2, partial [Ambispora gerdemannii]